MQVFEGFILQTRSAYGCSSDRVLQHVQFLLLVYLFVVRAVGKSAFLLAFSTDVKLPPFDRSQTEARRPFRPEH